MTLFRYIFRMVKTHSLGYPRIGADRELKFALDRYWRGTVTREDLLETADRVHRSNLLEQKNSGLELIPAGDFSLYDHVLDTSELLHDLPQRVYGTARSDEDPVDTYFRAARGRSIVGEPTRAGEMTKWFDTNYHYIVPEFDSDDEIRLEPDRFIQRIKAGIDITGDSRKVKPVVLGPVSYLMVGKPRGAALSRLKNYLPLYRELLATLGAAGIEWVQIDEPVLVLDLDESWQEALVTAYSALSGTDVRLLLTTYFGEIGDNIAIASALRVDGYHLDALQGTGEPNTVDLDAALRALPEHAVVSLGVVDGRNVWRTDLSGVLNRIEPIREEVGDRLWLAPTCSLLHVPYDTAAETELDAEIRSWLAFARQKLSELDVLKRALNDGRSAVSQELAESDDVLRRKAADPRRSNGDVRSKMERLSAADAQRDRPYAERAPLQRRRLQLPPYPTTTIGSFPQTTEIRRIRRAWRNEEVSNEEYTAAIKSEIAEVVRAQEEAGLDVLVHGEAERNDMVEYFGEYLSGFAFSRNGWVQSYGSRCVKPPIIYGDVARPESITVHWISYAASLTDRPMKGMLTGPITILRWSFVRDDQSHERTATQIALALRDEVLDLERAGIAVIQMDEPAFREGLPLRRSRWEEYLSWASRAFRITVSAVGTETQIHTHMCYSEFNDIIEWIAALDADVITMETSRSDMELLEAFSEFDYPNEIGPGVYDIHSPNIPTVAEMVRLMRRAGEHLPADRLWINPDCGLKTRRWEEVRPSLTNMVAAAKELRRGA